MICIDLEECVEDFLFMMDEYDWSEETKREEQEDDLFCKIYDWLEDIFECDIDENEEINSFVLDLLDYYFNYFFQEKKEIVEEKINFLIHVKQPEQRTKEWYEMRNTIVSASNCYKIFGTEKLQNQFIKEKCNPKEISENVNVDNACHWGQKYESLSISFYEYFNQTQIREFGCIPHSKYSFLGASPDGINVDINSEKYGRMLEIKNVVTREITGIPKNEYWVQMQIQMEVCDLDLCDFLETKFYEYELKEDFDKDGSFLKSENSQKINKGMIIYFSHPDNSFQPKYIYKPLSMDEKDFDLWYEKIFDQYEKEGYFFVKNIYWRLDIFYTTIVHRDKKWFQENVNKIESFWKKVEETKSSPNHIFS